MNLGGLGSLAGGFAPAVDQLNQDYASGLGIYAMAGQQPPGQAPAGQGQPGLGSLMGGNLLNQPTPTMGPQPGQGGIARSPMPQPSAAPQQASLAQAAAPPSVAPPSMPRAAPMVAQPGVSPPGQAAQPPGPAGPTGTAALAQQQQQPQPQPQQQRQPFNPAKFSNMFDMPTLVSNLLKTPGMNPMKLGAIVRSDGFKTMLNAQGLQQYRALNLMLGQERIGLGQERIDQGDRRIDQGDRRQGSLDKYRGGLMDWRKQALGYGSSVRAILQEARSKIAAITNDPNIEQKDKQKQIDAINADTDKRMKEADKGLSEPPQGEDETSSGAQEPDVMYDQQGNPHHYKGKGDRADPANWD